MRHLPQLLTILALCACSSQTWLQTPVPTANVALRDAGAKGGRLFVSEPTTGEIYVYDAPSLTLVTILQTFKRPEGECADNSGDAWVADPGSNSIDELDYAGKIVAQIHDKSGSPYSCAWDNSSANLAVTNSEQVGKAGAVLVYRYGKGTPVTIKNPIQASYDFLGYDQSSNLYFDGGTSQGKFVLSELSSQDRKPHTVSISGVKIVTPGFVQWNAASGLLDVADQDCRNANTTCIYELQLLSNTAKVVNEIDLTTHEGSKVCDVVQAVIFSGKLYGSDNETCGYGPSATYYWHYPAGGAPVRRARDHASAPFGAAVTLNA